MAINPEEKEFDLLGEFSEDFSAIRIEHHITNRYVLKSLQGKRLSITVKPYKELRTEAQNRYLRGPMISAIKQWYKETQGVVLTGDQIYCFILDRVLGHKPKVTTIMGHEVIVFPKKSLSKYSKEDFGQAIEIIIEYFAQRGCYISPPVKNNHLHELLENNKNIKDE